MEGWRPVSGVARRIEDDRLDARGAQSTLSPVSRGLNFSLSRLDAPDRTTDGRTRPDVHRRGSPGVGLPGLKLYSPRVRVTTKTCLLALRMMMSQYFKKSEAEARRPGRAAGFRFRKSYVYARDLCYHASYIRTVPVRTCRAPRAPRGPRARPGPRGPTPSVQCRPSQHNLTEHPVPPAWQGPRGESPCPRDRSYMDRYTGAVSYVHM